MKAYNSIVIISLFILLIVACAPRTAAHTPRWYSEKKVTEGFRRGLWIRSAAIASPASISRIVQIAGELHITDIFVQVVVGGYAYYNSKLLPRSQYLSRISEPGYDPLDSFIRAFNHTPVRIHAWVNTFLYWSLPDPPDSLSHVYYSHPDWFIEDVNRRSMVSYSYQQWKGLRIEGLYLNPANPHVAAFVQDVCGEIASRYPVEGIHLDFIRYPGILWGLPRTEESAVLAGIDADKIRYSSTIGYGRSDLYERWQIWHAWRLTRNRQWTIECMINDISNRVKRVALKNECQLSAAVFANPSLGRYSFAQNWTEWVDDFSQPIVMSYTPDVTLFLDYLVFANRNRPDAIMGIGLLWPEMQQTALLQEIAARNANTAGVCYFDFTSIDTMADLLSALRDTVQREDHCPDSTGYEPAGDVFRDRPRPEYVLQGKRLTDWGDDIDFAAFLLSLSLNPNRDLMRMGMNRETFIDLVSTDVAAFLHLDREIFPLGGELIEPPQRSIRFTFVPYLDEDSAAVLQKAEAISEFAHQAQLYPLSTDPLAKAAFVAETGTREVRSTPAGVYVFVVDTVIDGGRRMPRQDLSTETFPIYANWTIRDRFMKILGEGD
jgi:uncharacterized lipoprotein YddW (UPF0748 family)